MSSAEIAQSIIAAQLRTAELELIYERSLRKAERICDEESLRVLRVQLLLLQHENNDLREQGHRDEDQQHHLEKTNDDLRAHLSEVEADSRETQLELKARLRDLEYLKAELNELNAASAESSRILSEKLALTRELNKLKPELEHLKSQASTQQNLLSEKLALQRELASVQVELETEKRAVQRITAREHSAARQDSTLQGEIEDLKKELSKAHRDLQKTERDSRKKVVEWEGEKEILEGKLDAFRNKLRSTKEQLSEAQDEIERLQAEKMAQSAEMTQARVTGKATVLGKRPIPRFDPDMTIGTPGHGAPAAKKQRVSVNFADKSNFSITPFLNRTLSILPETPEDQQQQEKEEARESAKPETNNAAAKSRAAPKTKAVKPKEKPGSSRKQSAASTGKTKTLGALKESTNARANTTMKRPQLAKLIEEDSDVENDAVEPGIVSEDSADKDVVESIEGTQSTNDDAPELLKKSKAPKKRANIFDEEEESAPTQKVRDLGRGGSGNTSILGRVNLKANPVGKPKSLAEFSPLKRDRRAASVAI
ncbi:hypothetical protein PV08_07371 [Exophiala spinifera]|uniref:Uncharacterized protein n=1 Tax=Exophiala spinifera TaxID=91928 RepID=A0A0D1ZP65_9EURO|nr:uncharacterized protein PV08_07371 [Exophiala spinifera]KIW14587.1 hypothetical protein PV08_07371 [Exophiala spinifera]